LVKAAAAVLLVKCERFLLVIDLLRECAENEDRSQQGVLRSVIRDGLKQRAAAAHA